MENTIPQNTGSRTDIGPSICDPVDLSPPGSSIHGILQARILEWVATSFSRDLPDPGIEPRSPALQADASPSEPPGKPIEAVSIYIPTNNAREFPFLYTLYLINLFASLG